MNANPKLFRNFRQNITASTPTTLQIPQALNNFTKENCILEKLEAKLLMIFSRKSLGGPLPKSPKNIVIDINLCCSYFPSQHTQQTGHDLIQGVFFNWPPPESSKYKKVNLG